MGRWLGRGSITVSPGRNHTGALCAGSACPKAATSRSMSVHHFLRAVGLGSAGGSVTAAWPGPRSSQGRRGGQRGRRDLGTARAAQRSSLHRAVWPLAHESHRTKRHTKRRPRASRSPFSAWPCAGLGLPVPLCSASPAAATSPHPRAGNPGSESVRKLPHPGLSPRSQHHTR